MNGHTFLPPRAVKAGGSPQRHEQTLPVLSAGLVTLQLMSLLQELLAQGSPRLTSVGRLWSESFKHFLGALAWRPFSTIG